jgi:hypothetical protein
MTTKTIGFYGAARDGKAVRLLWVERTNGRSVTTRLDVTEPSDRKMADRLESLNCSGAIGTPEAMGFARIG